MIISVTSQTTLNIVDWTYKPTRVFSACFVLTRTLIRKIPSRSPIQNTTPNQARLTVEFL